MKNISGRFNEVQEDQSKNDFNLDNDGYVIDGQTFEKEITAQAFCSKCEKRVYNAVEAPPILSKESRIQKGWKELEPNLWVKMLDSCSRRCELKIKKPSITIDKKENKKMKYDWEIKRDQEIERLFSKNWTLEEFKKEAVVRNDSNHFTVNFSEYSTSIYQAENEDEAIKEAFQKFDLIIRHQKQVNIHNVFISGVEEIDFSAGKKTGVVARVVYSKVLDLWFYSYNYYHKTGGGGGSPSLSQVVGHPVKTKDLAIFCALIGGRRGLIGNADSIPMLKKLDEQIKNHLYTKLAGMDFPEWFSELKIPSSIF